CGVVGIKPTAGLVGRAGVVPLSPVPDTAGPMARSGGDAAARLAGLAPPDPDGFAPAGPPGPGATKLTPVPRPRAPRGRAVGDRRGGGAVGGKCWTRGCGRWGRTARP